MKRIFLAALIISIHLISVAGVEDAVSRLESDPDYVDVSGIAGVAVDLRYASTNNFLGTDLYGPFNRAFLQKLAADKLRVAAQNLQKVKPGYRLLVLDAARPRSVQKKLWERVVGTPMQHYVGNPAKGSVHNFGFAVDLTVIDDLGKELDMGTPFDTFDPLSQPKLEGQFLHEEKLSAAQLQNRLLLRKAMEDAGFIQLPIEWWHYDALPPEAVRKKYKIIE